MKPLRPNALRGARVHLWLCLLGATVASPESMAAQSREVTLTLSSDSVRVAEVFDLVVAVPVPPGSVVYFPDTLPATADVESHGPVEWRARRSGGEARLELTYPLMPFGMGTIALPRVDLIVQPLVRDVEGERIPGGSVVGAWSEAPGSSRYARTVRGAVWVEPVYTSEDVAAGMSPRPPADVLGLGWSWPSLLLILVFSSVLGGVVVGTTREWLSTRSTGVRDEAPGPLSIAETRRRTINELERLRAAGPYPPDRAFDLYGRSSRLVRTYAQRLGVDWGPELTVTELSDRLDAAGRATPELLAEMQRAEAVKFGRVRPDASTTEEHLAALLVWLSAEPADADGARADAERTPDSAKADR